MKYFTLLFSCWLLGLSSFPCGDRDECKVKTGTIATAPAAQEKHPNDSEGCAPLCHCSCCAASVCFQPVAAYKMPKIIFASASYPVYEISYSFQLSFSIWQPPKFS